MTAVAVTPETMTKLALIAALRLVYNVEKLVELSPDVAVAVRGLNSDLSNEIIPDGVPEEDHAETLATAIARGIAGLGIAGTNEHAAKLMELFGITATAPGAAVVSLPGTGPIAEPVPTGMWKVEE